MALSALVVGATGLVGSHVLSALLAHEAYSRVVTLTRRPLERSHDKLDARTVDFDSLESASLSPQLQVAHVYLCLGTTIKVAGSREKFHRVDHDYSVWSAKLGKAAGATRCALVSSVGASTRASSFYLRVKGETERDVGELGFERLVVARPSFLVGERTEHRPGERVGIAVSKALAFTLVAGLRKYRPIDASTVAGAMVASLLAREEGPSVLEFDALAAASSR